MYSGRYSAFIRISLAIVICLTMGGSLIFAQNKTLDRDLEPIIMQGGIFSEFQGVAVDELFLFVYLSGTWEQIPFQIDERDNSGSFFNQDEIAGLDENDELVFMARDAGDRAVGSWIDNTESQAFLRYEIEVVDPLDPNKKAWVYLYRSGGTLTTPQVNDYVDRIIGPNGGDAPEDTITGVTYKIGHTEKGLLGGFLSFNQFPNLNFLDRQKIRGRAKPIIGSDIVFTENDFEFVSINSIDGPVRVIRQIVVSVLGLLETPIPIQYFGFSASIQGNLDIPDLGIVKIQLLGQSLDLSANAVGMKFFNQNNSDITIDGVSDENIITDIDTLPNVNWTLITGSNGSIVNLLKISAIGDNRELFYKDKADIKDASDTGDSLSYGDTGIIVTGENIIGKFPLGFTVFFLDSNQPSSVGSQLAQFEQNPLRVNQNSQTFDEVVKVELASFTATAEKNHVQLVWITATETNNFGFDIERRVHGADAWTKIDFIHGKETSNVLVHYEYTDRNLKPGSYDYRLKQIDADGSFDYSGIVTAVVGLPETFALAQNFPNPFNPSTIIQYQLPGIASESSGNRTILKIYNLLGVEVRTLVEEEQAPGYYEVIWNGTDNLERRVSSGVYIYQLKYGDFTTSKKMVIMQ